jgi:hypothetical protein
MWQVLPSSAAMDAGKPRCRKAGHLHSSASRRDGAPPPRRRTNGKTGPARHSSLASPHARGIGTPVARWECSGHAHVFKRRATRSVPLRRSVAGQLRNVTESGYSTGSDTQQSNEPGRRRGRLTQSPEGCPNGPGVYSAIAHPDRGIRRRVTGRLGPSLRSRPGEAETIAPLWRRRGRRRDCGPSRGGVPREP